MNKPLPKRIISLDYGLARIGMAISDESQTIASSLQTVTTEKKVEKTVEKLHHELLAIQKKFGCEIEEIVVGLPLLMSGKKGSQADEVLHFIELFKTVISIPILTWDERLTTVQAERALREGALNRKKRSKVVDAVAAVLILQNYLDHKKNQTSKN
ncbi:Holliday junction resolvase RuvX [Parachlamydia sp. AcF125]|uniref:Holliday junction resolvase RuvX n=1 Tax=Parachlamydia sp. AcF125 TaxID=2795736 RepID=UPI001BCA19B9|nr:Holliday junction resolvase RuvX [Parachlamydia sp. AcF125]MBS4168309.1 putative pre-16S rRNA nuclease [Parachlamydia sp. AcF125]